MSRMTAWHDDDEFWRDTAPAIFSAERMGRAATDVDQLLRLVSLPRGASVLDMGCGPGRHAVELAARGFSVTGVDRTSQFLEMANEDARKRGTDAEWVRADMREFRRDNAFDLALSLLTTFGYFEDQAEDQRVAGNLFASLKPGGRLVMDLMGKEVLARVFQRRDWRREPDGTVVIEERSVARDWSWIDMCWIVQREGRCHERRCGHRIYSAVEIKELLARAGFVDLAAHGSLEGVPYDDRAERLVILARKPNGRVDRAAAV